MIGGLLLGLGVLGLCSFVYWWMRPPAAQNYKQQIDDWYVDEPFIKPLALPAVKALKAKAE
jgi:hypothetical protein